MWRIAEYLPRDAVTFMERGGKVRDVSGSLII